MNFDLSATDLVLINNALCAKYEELHRCYIQHYNVDNKSVYAARLLDRAQCYRNIYKKLNDGLDIVDL